MALGNSSIARVRSKIGQVNTGKIKNLDSALEQLVSLPAAVDFENDTEWGRKNIGDVKTARQNLGTLSTAVVQKLINDTNTWLNRQQAANDAAVQAAAEAARAQYSN